MSKIIIILISVIVKFYKYLISPVLGIKCRYLPTCSEYLMEALDTHGIMKGLYLGLKRLATCHPVKFLGGKSGLDFVQRKKKIIKGKI